MTPAVLGLLAAGRAPAVWQRQMARRLALVRALAPRTGWAAEFVTALPELRLGPLWGESLAALADRATRPPEPEPEAARRAAAGPWREPAPERGRGAPEFSRGAAERSRIPPAVTAMPPGVSGFPASGASAARAGRLSAGLVTDLPRQAGAALLGRLAERQSIAGRSGAQAGAAARRPGEPRQGTRPSAGRGRPAEEYPHPAGQAPGTGQAPAVLTGHDGPATLAAWQSGLARRAAGALAGDGPVAVGAPSATGAPLIAGLAAQWSAPIGGPAAPEALLLRLAGLAPGAPAPGREERERGPVESGAANRLRPGSALPPLAGRGQPVRSAASEVLSRAAPRDTASGPLAPGQGRAEDRLLGTQDTGGAAAALAPATAAGTADHELILPPALAALLPRLVPARRAGEPTPPVASAAVRSAARAENAAADDLDDLAEKIRRILDDEARRHGIGV